MSVYLGIDMGATKTLVAACDASGAIMARRRVPTEAAAGGDAYVERVSTCILRTLGDAGASIDDVVSTFMAVPGPLDASTGQLLDPPYLGWGTYDLTDRLSAALGGAPVRIENDCTVGGYGEWASGAGEGTQTLIYLGVGTGLGGAVICDGKLHLGTSGNAGELGHLIVWRDGPLCGCGNRGCVEAISSGSGMTSRARELAERGEAPGILERAGSLEQIEAPHVTSAWLDGDDVATTIVDDAIWALGAASASLMSALSPDVLVIGGGIPPKMGAGYIARVEEIARDLAFGPNAAATTITAAAHRDDSALMGAIALAIRGDAAPAML